MVHDNDQIAYELSENFTINRYWTEIVNTNLAKEYTKNYFDKYKDGFGSYNYRKRSFE